MSKIYRYNMTPDQLGNRLRALKKDGCVVHQNYRDRSKDGNPRAHKFTHRLYALDEGAVETLTKVGYTRDKIRLGLPPPLLVTHELMVTDVVRALKREGSQLSYDYQILDDRAIKSIDVLKKYGSIPDLSVALRFIVDNEHKRRLIAIEVDNDTEIPPVIFNKLIKHKVEPIILITCKSLKRLDNLQTYLHKQVAYAAVMEKVFFAILSDFCKNGFFDTDFINVRGNGETFMPTKGRVTPFADKVHY
jgi:hypothetical protein